MVERLWQVYRSLVAAEYGDRMEVSMEREAVALIGQIAAEFDFRLDRKGERSLYERMKFGLIEGTTDWDDMARGYSLAISKLSQAIAGKRD